MLLKTDHLVSLYRFFLFPPCSLHTSTPTSLLLRHGGLYLSSAFPPVAAMVFFTYTSCPPFTILCALQASSKLNDSCLRPSAKEHICSLPVPCCLLPRCWSSLLHLSAHVCSEPATVCPLSIQYPSQVNGSSEAPVSSKPFAKIARFVLCFKEIIQSFDHPGIVFCGFFLNKIHIDRSVLSQTRSRHRVFPMVFGAAR